MGKRKETEPGQENTATPLTEVPPDKKEEEEVIPSVATGEVTDGAQDAEDNEPQVTEGDYSKIPEGDFSIVWRRPTGNEITTKATKQMIAHAEKNGWIPVGEVGYDPEAQET